MNAQAEAKAARELAYKIAGALQQKLSGQIVGVRIDYLPICERLVVEYTLTDGGKAEASTAYSQAYFEDTSKEHLRWLATQIYTQLKQRFEWAMRGHNGTNSTHASGRSERPERDQVSRTSVVQNRRRKSSNAQGRTTKPKNAGNPESIHTEQVPASVFGGA